MSGTGDAMTPAATPGLTPAAATGSVAAALVRLEELDGRPTTEHVALYDDVHRLLQDALATLDGA